MFRLCFAIFLAAAFLASSAKADHPWGSSLYCTVEDDAIKLVEMLSNPTLVGQAGRMIHSDNDFKCYFRNGGVGPMIDGSVYTEFRHSQLGHSCVIAATYDGPTAERGMPVWAFAKQADCWSVMHEKVS